MQPSFRCLPHSTDDINWNALQSLHRDSERLLHFDTKFEHEERVLLTQKCFAAGGNVLTGLISVKSDIALGYTKAYWSRAEHKMVKWWNGWGALYEQDLNQARYWALLNEPTTGMAYWLDYIGLFACNWKYFTIGRILYSGCWSCRKSFVNGCWAHGSHLASCSWRPVPWGGAPRSAPPWRWASPATRSRPPSSVPPRPQIPKIYSYELT